MRLLRPLLWLVGGVGAFVGFVAVGRATEVPLRWGDLSGWLDEVSIEEALVELARWLGMALAVYVDGRCRAGVVGRGGLVGAGGSGGPCCCGVWPAHRGAGAASAPG